MDIPLIFCLGQYCPRPTGRPRDILRSSAESFCFREDDAGMQDENCSLVERIFQDEQLIRSLGIELTSCGEGSCEMRVNGPPSLGSNTDLSTLAP
jgi:hypothetical protein